jgi:hypothetical protein
MIARFCVTHKDDDMVDVVSKRCEHLGCPKHPSFGDPGEMIARFCVAHKDDDMIDVVSKRCEHAECETHATYGPLFGRAIHCAQHADKVSEFKHRSPKCATEGCLMRPTKSVNRTNYPTHCDEHAPPDARDVEAAICSKCHCATIIDAHTHLCGACMFGAKWGTVHKFNESRMGDTLAAHAIVPFSADKVPEEGAAFGVRRRPDFMFRCKHARVVLEVDEVQHARKFMRPSTNAPSASRTTGYSCECELTRMIELHSVFREPTIFIRYNPDKYVDSDGKTVGALPVRDGRCADYLQYILNRANSAPVKPGMYVAYLYYDGARPDNGHSPRADLFSCDYIESRVDVIDAI